MNLPHEANEVLAFRRAANVLLNDGGHDATEALPVILHHAQRRAESLLAHIDQAELEANERLLKTAGIDTHIDPAHIERTMARADHVAELEARLRGDTP